MALGLLGLRVPSLIASSWGPSNRPGIETLMQLVANAATLRVLSSVNDTDEEDSIPPSIGRPILYLCRDRKLI